MPADIWVQDRKGLKWRERAAGGDLDPYEADAAFFPERGARADRGRELCARCPVRAECLQFALDNDEPFGLWGGLSERQRRQLKRERKGARRVRVA